MGQPQSRATSRELQPGDHIYSARKGGLYDHHGIYVGDGMVIHLLGPAKKIGLPSCQKCGDKRFINGEIARTCLDCFLDGPLQFYDYGVPIFEFNIRRRGTCSVRHSRPAHEVIKTATDLLEGDGEFGRYDLFANNCEDFAVYCKTGRSGSMQVLGHVERLGLAAGPFGAVVFGAYGVAKVITDANRRP